MTLTLPIRLDPHSAPDETLHVTASGLPVRIYSINGGGDHPIHGAIFQRGYWTPEKWTDSGLFLLSKPNPLDLRDRPKAKRGWWIGVYTKGDLHFSCTFPDEHSALAYRPGHGYECSGITYLAEGDGLDTPAEPPLWVDWGELPSWAKWAAADEGGYVWFYSEKPLSNKRIWGPDSADQRCAPLAKHLYRLAPGFDWRETLTQRPEGV